MTAEVKEINLPKVLGEKASMFFVFYGREQAYQRLCHATTHILEQIEDFVGGKTIEEMRELTEDLRNNEKAMLQALLIAGTALEALKSTHNEVVDSYNTHFDKTHDLLLEAEPSLVDRRWSATIQPDINFYTFELYDE